VGGEKYWEAESTWKRKRKKKRGKTKIYSLWGVRRHPEAQTDTGRKKSGKKRKKRKRLLQKRPFNYRTPLGEYLRVT